MNIMSTQAALHNYFITTKSKEICIALDGRCLNVVHLRGIGKYIFEIIRHACRDIRWEIYSDRPDLPMHLPKDCNINITQFEMRGHRFNFWEQLGLPYRLLKDGTSNLLHSPANVVPFLQPLPSVVTIHDTIAWVSENEAFNGIWYREHLLPKAFHRCRAIITISSSSARAILKLWPALESKLYIVHHGIGHEYMADAPISLSNILFEYKVNSPYILYVGGEIKRKRLDLAINVFEKLNDPELLLVICGVNLHAHEEVRTSAPPHIQNRIRMLPYINEDSMPSLYSNAAVVLYPSEQEGFGFPLLEAQALGVPVLCSKEGSIPELIGPCAQALPAGDLNAWVSACRSLLDTRKHSLTPNSESRSWVRRFSWENAAAKTTEIYRSAISPHLSK
jgi:glycosyltransferase involved in cell wall biosynthesis